MMRTRRSSGRTAILLAVWKAFISKGARMIGRFSLKLFSLFFIVASVAAAQEVPPRKDIPAIAKAANGAVVSIVMSDKDGSPIVQGSGFLVSMDGLIVTNYHVIENGSSAVVKLPDGAFFVVD